MPRRSPSVDSDDLPISQLHSQPADVRPLNAYGCPILRVDHTLEAATPLPHEAGHYPHEEDAENDNLASTAQEELPTSSFPDNTADHEEVPTSPFPEDMDTHPPAASSLEIHTQRGEVNPPDDAAAPYDEDGQAAASEQHHAEMPHADLGADVDDLPVPLLPTVSERQSPISIHVAILGGTRTVTLASTCALIDAIWGELMRMNVPQVHSCYLVHKGKTLRPGVTLHDTGIRRGDILQLIPHVRGGSPDMQNPADSVSRGTAVFFVLVRLIRGNTLVLRLPSHDVTVNDIWEHLYDRDIPIHENMYLTYESRRLPSQTSLHDLGITKGATLCVCMRLRGAGPAWYRKAPAA